MIKYLSKAFFFHWNLLALGAGLVFGILSGRPDVAVPLVAAAEVLYLALLSTRTRFQKAVDAEAIRLGASRDKTVPDQEVGRILASLSHADLRRYEDLKDLCLTLHGIARNMKNLPGQGPERIPEGEMAGLNRLLWIWLKLLFSKSALESYFRTVDEAGLLAGMERARAQIQALGPQEEDEPSEVPKRQSLADTLKTYEVRLAGLRAARENHSLMELELERLRGKIAGIAEIGISGQDTALFTSEINVAAESIQSTEKVMSEVAFLTGFSQADEKPPQLLAVARQNR